MLSRLLIQAKSASKETYLGVSLIITALFSSIFVFSVFANANTELLTSNWVFTAQNGASENYQNIDPSSLQNKDTLRLTFNLHGTCILGGDASAIIFDQPAGSSWHYISLSDFAQNCLDGDQVIDIPLTKFSGLDGTRNVGIFHARFWLNKPFNITISSAQLLDSTSLLAMPTPLNQPLPSPTPSTSPIASSSATPSPSSPSLTLSSPPSSLQSPTSWAIQSVSTMKETKDKICGQDSIVFINQWLDKAKELGANYISIETPYDNPSCASSLSYTAEWVSAARSKGFKIWHRHMPLAFEGIYNVGKSKQNFLNLISNYIKNNPNLFQSGDIFSPIPEPQNGGIAGVTYCSLNICQFNNASDFNSWLRQAIDVSNQAFSSIGLGNQIKVGYYGFDGFIAWGDNNPDWHGILENSTIQKMGEITIDHYPETQNETMAAGLDTLQAKYPGVPIVIGEWGTVTNAINPIQQVLNTMGASKRPGVIGFNYWHMGMGGNESLINTDFTDKPQFTTVESFFKH